MTRSAILTGTICLVLCSMAVQTTSAQQVSPQPPDLTGIEERLDSLAAEISLLRSRVEESPGVIREEQTAEAGADRVLPSAEGIRNLGLQTLAAFLVAIFVFFFLKGAIWLLNTLAERNAARRLLFKKLIPMVRLLVWGAAIYYIAAGVFQIDRAGLLTISAALGIAIGFASQDILKNIFGGILIVFDQPFQVGDKIRVSGTYGEVVSIGLRSTRIVTPDDNLVSVPNSQIVEGQVANANAGALDCQVVVDLYIPGWADATLAKRIAYDAASNSRFVYLDKPIVINLADEFKETFLTRVRVKAYVIDTRHEFALASDITEAAKKEFLRQGILEPMMFRSPVPSSTSSEREENDA
jgi:small-conductance mechanosensitive channel